MSPEMDKAKLLDLIAAEYAFVQRTVALVPPARRAEPMGAGAWSLKDTLAHLTRWNRRVLRWWQEAESGQPPVVAEPGYLGLTDANVNALNNRDAAADKDRTWDDVWTEFNAVHGQVVALLGGYSEEDLFGLVRFRGIWSQPPWRLIAGNTHEHYAYHMALVRERLLGDAQA